MYQVHADVESKDRDIEILKEKIKELKTGGE